jgi:hypothetical protein
MKKGKRSNGDGYIQRSGSGKWQGQLMSGYKSDGKRNIVCFVGETKTEVADRMREYQKASERLDVNVSRKTTFGDWADTWYGDMES